jgi:transcriptional regulator with XRE-family HTH domain
MIDKLEILLREKGLTQAALEKLVGLSENKISKWKQKGEPRASEALRMARTLGVPVEYLIDDAMDEPGGEPGLTADERTIVDLFRVLGIGKLEAMRRLTATPAGYVESADATIREAAPPVRGPKRLGGKRGKG